MTNYDFEDFLSSIRHLDRQDIHEIANKRFKELEKSKGVANKKEAIALAKQIEQFLYWLESGRRPPGIDKSEFMKFKPLCQNLIEKKQAKPSYITIFEK